LGTGFLEAVYANALAIEFARQGLAFEKEKEFVVFYQGQKVGVYYADFVVSGHLVVELKALARTTAEHEAQVMNYLRASGITVGLLLNFGTPRLGIKRLVSGHDDLSQI
jgi:GxxExxY protein